MLYTGGLINVCLEWFCDNSISLKKVLFYVIRRHLEKDNNAFCDLRSLYNIPKVPHLIY